MSDTEKQSDNDKPVEDKAYLWKYATIIAVIALAAMIVFNALDAYRASAGPSLTASVRGGGFSVPPSMLNDSGAVFNSMYGPLKGRMTLQIRNSGDFDAESVRVQTKDNGRAYLEWDDGNAEEIIFQNDVPIGNLPIAKSVTVTLWTENVPDENSPPLIAHKSGSTHAEYPRHVSPWLVVLLSASAIATFVLYLRERWLAMREIGELHEQANRILAAQETNLTNVRRLEKALESLERVMKPNKKIIASLPEK